MEVREEREEGLGGIVSGMVEEGEVVKNRESGKGGRGKGREEGESGIGD